MANVSSSNGLEKHPKLRFPGFDEPWSNVELGSKLIPYSEITTENNQFPPLTSSRKGLFLQTDYFNRQVASEDNTGYNIVPYGYFTYRHMSDDLTFYFNINEIVEKGIVSTLYPVFTTTDGLNSHFLRAYLNYSKRFASYCVLQKQGGSRTYMYFRKLCAHNAVIPSIEEQEKIADFIDLLDQRIKLQNEKIECLKKYKRGVMQHIFHQHDAQGDEVWTCVRLGDIFKKVSRRNTNGMVKNVITNSAEYGLIPQRDFFDKDIAVDGNTTNYYVIEEGDFVYNPRKSNTAPYGPFNRYTLSERGIISPLYTCLVLQADINPSYLAWYFRSDAWHRYIYDNGSQGVRHDRVSMTDDLLMGIPVMFPDNTKQQVYADVLDKIEARLQAAQKEYELLAKAKDGYVQQLFI